jgi:hypothetical protein
MNGGIRMKPGSSRKPHPSRPSWATYWIFHAMGVYLEESMYRHARPLLTRYKVSCLA